MVSRGNIFSFFLHTRCISRCLLNVGVSFITWANVFREELIFQWKICWGGGLDLAVLPGIMGFVTTVSISFWFQEWRALPGAGHHSKIKPFHKSSGFVSSRAHKVVPWSILGVQMQFTTTGKSYFNVVFWAAIEVPLTLGIQVGLSVSFSLFSVMLSKGSRAGLGWVRAAGQGHWLGLELVCHISLGNFCCLLS